jgi:Heavy metal binding domain
MKLILKSTFIILMATAFVAVSCNSNKTSAPNEVDQSGSEYTSAYTCPMHCAGSGNDEPGICPVCKMKYRPNANHEANHDMVYACPMHQDITGVEGDSCSKCHMILKPIKGSDDTSKQESDIEDHSAHNH